MTGEVAAFRAFKETPSPDTLVDLLRAHQERIFRLCYQVLHNAADAEDAAQEALLKIPGELRRFSDPDSFRRWLYRVSLNAALVGARKAARRRAHETRAAMEKPAPTPLDASTRLALFEALAGLDERPRNLVLEHYFEGESLESIGRREGCSAPAVCKKLDDARESLRRRLGGAGAMAALPNLEALFPAAPAAPDLLSGPVLAKVAALATGGIVMSTKIQIAAIALTAILCLTAGTGIGVALKGRSERAQRERVDDLERQLAVAVNAMKTAPPDLPPAPTGESAKPESKPAISPLTVRLDRFKAWKKASRLEVKEQIGKVSHEEIYALQQRKWREEVKELEGLSALVFAEPEVFLAFLKDPSNATYFEGFVAKALGFARLDHPVHIMNRPQDFAVFPAALVEGLLDLTNNGSETQRSEAFSFFARLTGMPAEYADHFRNLIHDPNPEIQVSAINVITGLGPATGETVQTLIDLGSRSPHETVRSRVAAALEHVDQPEAVSYLFERLEAPRDNEEMISVTKALSFKILVASRIGGQTNVSADRFLNAISAQWGRGYDERSFKLVVSYLLECPEEKVRKVLGEGLAAAPTAKSRDVLGEIARRWDEGEKDREVFKKILYGR